MSGRPIPRSAVPRRKLWEHIDQQDASLKEIVQLWATQQKLIQLQQGALKGLLAGFHRIPFLGFCFNPWVRRREIEALRTLVKVQENKPAEEKPDEATPAVASGARADHVPDLAGHPARGDVVAARERLN